MLGPDPSFFVELLPLIVCPVGLLIFSVSLVLFIRSGRPADAVLVNMAIAIASDRVRMAKACVTSCRVAFRS